MTLNGPATGRYARDGRLWIAEYARNCIVALDMVGEPIVTIGGCAHDVVPREDGYSSDAWRSAFDRPHMVTELSDASLAMSDTWNHLIQRF